MMKADVINNMEDEVRILINSMRNLAMQIQSSNSLLGTFWKGLVFGIASAIGASIVAAAIIATIMRFFDSIKELPFFK